MEQTDRAVVRNLVIGTLISVVLSQFGLGGLILTVPILIASFRVKDTKVALGAFAVLLVIVSAWTLIQNRALFGSEYSSLLYLGLLFPVCTIVGSGVWVALRDYTSSLLRRFFLCCIPAFVMGLAMSVYFAVDASQTLRDFYVQAVMALFNPEALGIDMTQIVVSVVNSLRYMFAPMAVIMLAIPVLISDVWTHRWDEQWQFDFANMKFPDHYVWIFLASWAIALVGRLVPACPELLLVLAWNTALVMAFLYGIVGLSILVAFARRRTTAITAGRIVFTVIMFCMIPVLNIIVIVALPVMGVLENWVRFR